MKKVCRLNIPTTEPQLPSTCYSDVSQKFTVHRTLILLLVWLEIFQTGRTVILLQLVQN